MTGSGPGSPLGLHRVLEPAGVLPQAAWRLDASPGLWPDEVRVSVERAIAQAAGAVDMVVSTVFADGGQGGLDESRRVNLGIRGKTCNHRSGQVHS
jgi:hypothetical protein